MTAIRSVKHVQRSKPTMEGAGVRLRRVFGYPEVKMMDPFLLLDDFGSDDPNDYMAGFPWHPHRGIETVTYMIQGLVEHQDSIGNKGIIRSGDIQWMTAGSGIIHQEMPGRWEGMMRGFQLWVNLPSDQKMMDPRYQEVSSANIPFVQRDDGTRIGVISGDVDGVRGPVTDIVVDPEYLDITLPSGVEFTHSVHPRYTVFAYILEGSGVFEPDGDMIDALHLVLFGDGEEIRISAGKGKGKEKDKEGIRFILVSGKPIGEPVAWYGPIVMNTQEELETAFKEYRDGTFIKTGK